MTLDEALARIAGDRDEVELAHVADHLGMGDMVYLRNVTPEAIRAHFATLTPEQQAAALRDIEECPW
jgi:hypothetical protein